MTATATVIQNSPSRTTIKVVATAGGDTSTITLKSSALTIGSTGNLTFDAATKTIVRATGSWATALVKPGTTISFTGTASNNTTFSVLSVGGTGNDTITVDRTVVSEVAGAASVTAYNSDLAFPGQTFTTPKANITSVKFALGGSLSVVRNSATVLNLYGTWMALNDGFGLAEQNDQNLALTFTTAGGTVFIELAKIDGFQTESQRFDVTRG